VSDLARRAEKLAAKWDTTDCSGAVAAVAVEMRELLPELAAEIRRLEKQRAAVLDLTLNVKMLNPGPDNYLIKQLDEILRKTRH